MSVAGHDPTSASRGVAVTASTVRQILTLPSFEGASVLAGASGLSRMVRSINTMEVPDVLPWTNAHELLLTTGYPMRSNPISLEDFVVELDKRSLAGLAIKLGRYIDVLPPEMLAKADELGFPIVQVPDGVPFSDMLNQVLLEVLGRSASAIAKAERDHEDLMQLVLHGEGIPEVLTAVQAQLSHDVDDCVIVGLAERTGTFTDVVGGDLTGRAAVILDDEGSFRSAAFRHGVHDVGGLSMAVGSVKAEGNRGHLVALRADRPWTSSEVITLERGATVAALVLTREAAVGAVEHQYRGDLLRDVLAGRMSVDTARGRARNFGWDLDGPKVVVVAADSPYADPPAAGLRADQRAKSWTSRIRSIDPRAASATYAAESVALIGCPTQEAPSTQVCEGLASSLAGSGERFDGIVGVSRVMTDLSDLPSAYAQAWEAVRVGRLLAEDVIVSRFEDLGLYRLLSWITDSAELRSFLSDTLGELAKPEGDPETDELRRTLAVLLETNLNVAETARQMHFHYNTLRYRVNKLEKLLGPFTTNARLRADLLVAIYVWQMRIAHA